MTELLLRSGRVTTVGGLVALALALPASRADAVETVATESVASGLAAPNLVTHAGDGSGRLFIVDQSGQIRIVDAGGNLLPTPFLDIASRMVPLGAFGPGSFDERGLLGLAFHPNFAVNQKFYVYYSAPQPPPDPITFEVGDTIPADVTITGGFIGTQFRPGLYCSGTRALEVAANSTATITFAEPVIKVRFYFVHRNQAGVTPGTITATFGDGSQAAPISSNLEVLFTPCVATSFVEIEDFGFPVTGIKQLDLQAGAGTGLVLFLDDLEVTRFNHKSRVSEFTVPALTPNEADPNSERVILEVDEPQFNHNSGTVAFGPDDGLLYITVGDGGNGDDQGPFHNSAIGNGQDKTVLLGSMLRVDVDGDDFPADPIRNYAIPPTNPFAATPGCADGCDEIFAYGLRNPFRFSFDMGGTHKIFCGDAGQELFEEINIISLGDNLGWNVKEGLHCFDPDDPFNPPAACPNTGPDGSTLVDPIIEYPHFQDNPTMTGPIGQVVIGGNIYRGTMFPGLAGRLVFGDFSRPPFGGPADGSVFLGTETSPGVWERTEPFISTGIDGRLKRFIMGFGQDAVGEVYLCTNTMGTPFGTTGTVFRIVPSRGDMDGNGVIELSDVPTFVDVLTGVNTDPKLVDRANVNGDGQADGGDVQALVNKIVNGPAGR